MNKKITYNIQRSAVASYLFTTYTLLILVLAAPLLLLIGIIMQDEVGNLSRFWVPLLWIGIPSLLFTLFGWWYARRAAQVLEYWLENDTLRVDQGVFFWQRKAVPLDRITDFRLVQGPLMRQFNVWSLNVQTAGMGTGGAEAVLLGIDRAEEVRNELLSARDAAVH